MLAPSQMLTTDNHRWKTKRSTTPALCIWCNQFIHSGSRAKVCARCNLTVHKKNCFAYVPTKCSGDKGTLMEQGRKFIKQYNQIQHNCVIIGKTKDTTTHSKKQDAKIILFNDSLLIYYGSEEEPQLISLIRWFSRTKNKKIEIFNSSEKSISITSPRDGKNHIFTCSNEIEKQNLLHDLHEISAKWFKNNKDQIDNCKTIEEKSISNENEIPSDIFLNSKFYFRIQFTIPVQNFTAYVIEVFIGNSSHSYTIFKRYSDFYSLHKTLRNVYNKKSLPNIPSKKRLRDNSCLHFIKKRCNALQEYLNNIIALDNILNVPEFEKFMKTTIAQDGEIDISNLQNDDVNIQNNQNNHQILNEDISEESFESDNSEETETDSTYDLSSTNDSIETDDISFSMDKSEDLEVEEKQESNDDHQADVDEHKTEVVDKPQESQLNEEDVKVTIVGIILFDFHPGRNSRGLRVDVGDHVIILSRKENTWWYCQTEDERTGFLPGNFIKIIHENVED